jgi:hypothetical protein
MSNQAGAVRQAPSENQRLASEAETADYIGDLLRQLEKLAGTSGLVRLQYLLREGVEEAEKLAAGT